MNKDLLEIHNLTKRITELYVVIDTLQTNLRSAMTHVDEEDRKIIENHSFKWCVGWKHGDEKD